MQDLTSPSAEAVAVVIVNWNGWRLSLECLASLRQSLGVEWHLFLVDNASTDDSREHLLELGLDTTVVLSDVNGGWTGGNNLGLRHAMQAGYKHFFILNNDALVYPDTIAVLLDRSRAGERPVLGPVHLDGTGEHLDFIGATIDPATGTPLFMPVDGVELASLPPLYPTAYIKGAGLFIGREHFDRVGMFDDRYYLNYDETDWCFVARELGYPVMMTSEAKIVHSGSASIGGGLSPLNIYFVARNSLLFAEKHCSRRQRWRQAVELARWASRLTPEIKTRRRVRALLSGQSKSAVAVRLGVRDYVLRRFGDCPASIRALSGSR